MPTMRFINVSTLRTAPEATTDNNSMVLALGDSLWETCVAAPS